MNPEKSDLRQILPEIVHFLSTCKSNFFYGFNIDNSPLNFNQLHLIQVLFSTQAMLHMAEVNIGQE
jgi:hypothetical protein